MVEKVDFLVNSGGNPANSMVLIIASRIIEIRTLICDYEAFYHKMFIWMLAVSCAHFRRVKCIKIEMKRAELAS
jgi:hypothetical protein